MLEPQVLPEDAQACSPLEVHRCFSCNFCPAETSQTGGVYRVVIRVLPNHYSKARALRQAQILISEETRGNTPQFNHSPFLPHERQQDTSFKKVHEPLIFIAVSSAKETSTEKKSLLHQILQCYSNARGSIWLPVHSSEQLLPWALWECPFWDIYLYV